MNTAEAIDTLNEICFLYSTERLEKLKRDGHKLAHYTTAQNGLNILRGKTMWLRNATVMNDFSEIAHGRACLDEAFRSEYGNRFGRALNGAWEGLANRVFNRLHEGHRSAAHYTYLTSVSEITADETLGQLSMWRAYGGRAGVALVFNTDVLDSDTNVLNAFHSPVLYGDEQRFIEEFARVVKGLEANPECLRQVSIEQAENTIFYALQYAILSTKHQGFAEEREWRIIHTPMMDQSPFVKDAVEVVNGIPQIVYKLPLENLAGMNVPEMDLSKMLYRVIIGPCSYPREVAEAYAKTLFDDLGIAQPWSRIVVSQIPLRQWD